LLEALLGNREPHAGRARLGHGVEPAYFSQQEVELDDRGSVLQCVQTMTGLQRPQAQSLLGKFLFSGWGEHEKAVKVLSGGERRRLALVVASGANFLVLDEPTNHLDLESREALEAALEAFPGTVLLVSHDRALLDAVAERTLAIETGRVNSYDGGWADYVRVRDEGTADAAPTPPPRVEKRPRRVVETRKRSTRPTELDLVEAEIEAKEAAVEELERKLAEDWTDIDTIAAHRRAREELQALLTRWEALFERSQA
jgi:ATP-binding cassette subfamily F protein 3